jgi:CDP-diacylglycerol---serine O-phosphatidyltransferase
MNSPETTPSPPSTALSAIVVQLDYANATSLLVLGIGGLCLMATVQQQFHLALIALMAAGLVDLIDGPIARRITRIPLQAAVGQQLDGLVDLSAFGVVPVVFAFCFGLQTPLQALILLLFLGAAGLRTAYSSCVGLLNGTAYVGVPLAYSAVLLPLVCLTQFVLPSTALASLLSAVFLAHTIAMLCPIPIPKLRGIGLVPFFLGMVCLSSCYGWAIATGQ